MSKLPEHRYRVGAETVYVNPETGERETVRILSILREDDGSPIYGVRFKQSGRISCIADGDLVPVVRLTYTVTLPLQGYRPR